MYRSLFFWTAIGIFSWLGSTAAGQVGKESGLWKWTEAAAHHQAIVEIESGGGIGTGVLVAVNRDKPIKDGFEGYCLTAWHVVENDEGAGEIRVRFRNGRKCQGCRVVSHDSETDVAVIWVWAPGNVEPARLASEPVRKGDSVELAGLGGGSSLDCCIRHFSAIASPPSTGAKIFADVPLLPGDSGGPVFNSRHEVAGIISGGWFWYDAGVKSSEGHPLETTWPARASNVASLQGVMGALSNPTTDTKTVNR